MSANEELAEKALQASDEKICHEAVIRWFEKAKLVDSDTWKRLDDWAVKTDSEKEGDTGTTLIASKVLVRKSGKPCTLDLQKQKTGWVVGFYDNRAERKRSGYQHSMVVCKEGTLAGVNNSNVATFDAIVRGMEAAKARGVKDADSAAYCQMDVVKDLRWNKDKTIGTGNYEAYAEDAETIRKRIKDFVAALPTNSPASSASSASQEASLPVGFPKQAATSVKDALKHH